MAKQRNIPVRDIAANPILKAAYEKQLQENPVDSDFRKAASEYDPSSIKGVKDLSNVVRDQKTYMTNLDRTLKRLDKTINKVDGTMSKTMQVLTESLGIQRKMVSELQKLNNLTRREDDQMLEVLQDIDDHISNDGGKAEGHGSELASGLQSKLESILLSVFNKTALQLGSAGAGLFAGIKLNELIKDFTNSETGQKIGDAVATAKKSIGFTQENFPELTEMIRSWYGTGIPEMLGGKSKKEFEQSHNLTPNKAEVSESIKELQNKQQAKRIGEQRYHGDELTEEQKKKGYENPYNKDPNKGGYNSSNEQFSSGGEVPKNGWWTSEKQKQAVDYLIKNGGFTEYGAAAAVARMTKEAPKGPGDSNNIGGGHWGIAQWGVNRRGREMANASFEEQLAWYVKETQTTEKPAGERFRTAKNAQEGAYAAASFERAEGWKESGGKKDVLMNNTPIDDVYKNTIGQSSSTKQNTQESTEPRTIKKFVKGAGWTGMQEVPNPKYKAPDATQVASSSSKVVSPNEGRDANSQTKTSTAGEKAYSGNLEGVNSALVSAFEQAAAEYKQKTHKDVKVNSGLRTYEEQQKLWDNRKNNPNPVARPGTSLHEKGLAIDINSAQANEMDRMGILAKYGLNRPVPGDPPHIQLMGTKYKEASNAPLPNIGPPDTTNTSQNAQPVSQQPMTPSMGMPMMGGLGNIMGMIGGMGGMGGIGGMLGMAMPLIGNLLGSIFDESNGLPQGMPSRPASSLIPAFADQSIMGGLNSAVNGQDGAQGSQRFPSQSQSAQGLPPEVSGVGNMAMSATVPWADLLKTIFGSGAKECPHK